MYQLVNKKLWAVQIVGRLRRIEVAGDICLRRRRPAQGCRADDDDDDDDYDYDDTTSELNVT